MPEPDSAPGLSCEIVSPPSGYRADAIVSWTAHAASSAELTLLGESRDVELEGSTTLAALTDDVEVALQVFDTDGNSASCISTIEVERSPSLWILGMGQSNIATYFGWDEGGGEGEQYGYGASYLRGLLPSMPSVNADSDFVNGALSGSSLLERNQPTAAANRFWLSGDSKETFSPGPVLEAALMQIRARRLADEDVTMFLWGQGERDSNAINARAVAANSPAEAESIRVAELELYGEGMQYLIARVREEAESPNLPFGIQSLGRRALDAPINQIVFHELRMLQRQLASTIPSVRVLGDAYDVALYDQIHMHPNGRKRLLDRIAGNISAWRQGLPSVEGPRPVAAIREQRTVRLQLENVEGLQVGELASRLFRVTDQYGTILADSSSVSVDGSMLVLQFEEGDLDEAVHLVTAQGNLGTVPSEDYIGWSPFENGVSVRNMYDRPIVSTRIVLTDAP